MTTTTLPKLTANMIRRQFGERNFRLEENYARGGVIFNAAESKL